MKLYSILILYVLYSTRLGVERHILIQCGEKGGAQFYTYFAIVFTMTIKGMKYSKTFARHI